MPGIRRLNHAVLFVADEAVAARFYREVLGFEVVTTLPEAGAVFLRAPDSRNHHDLGLFGVGAGAPRPPRGATGLYHLAWQVDTLEDLVELRGAVVAAGAFTGESSHGATRSVYGVDPDGNHFELMWMVPRAEWGDYATAAITERLDLSTDLARWDGLGTADELGPGRSAAESS